MLDVEYDKSVYRESLLMTDALDLLAMTGTRVDRGLMSCPEFCSHDVSGSSEPRISRPRVDRRDDVAIVMNPPKAAVTGLRASGYHEIDRYAVLPNRTNPRWLVPLHNRRVATAFLETYVPYRVSSLVLAYLARQAARAGALRWSKDSLVIATKGTSLITDEARSIFNRSDIVMGISLGTPGPSRKLAVVAMDARGTRLGIAKLGRHGPAAESLRVEAGMLRALSARPALVDRVPRLLHELELPGYSGLVQTVLEGSRTAGAFSERHAEFLMRLTGDCHRQIRIDDTSQFAAAIKRAANAEGTGDVLAHESMEAVRRSIGHLEVPPTIVHGDFAPWNLRLRSGSIAAFDWEHGHACGVPGVDEIHFHLQTWMLLKRWSPDRSLSTLGRIALRHVDDWTDAAQRANVERFAAVDMYLRRLAEGHASTDPATIWWRELVSRMNDRTELIGRA